MFNSDVMFVIDSTYMMTCLGVGCTTVGLTGLFYGRGHFFRGQGFFFRVGRTFFRSRQLELGRDNLSWVVPSFVGSRLFFWGVGAFFFPSTQLPSARQELYMGMQTPFPPTGPGLGRPKVTSHVPTEVMMTRSQLAQTHSSPPTPIIIHPDPTQVASS